MQIDWVRRSEALRLGVRDFIGGKWTEHPHRGLEKLSPRDGRLLYQVASTDNGRVDEAVLSADRAFRDGRWSAVPLRRRRESLLSLAALMEKHREELALLECLDVGKPISAALEVDVPCAMELIRASANSIDKLFTKVYGAEQVNLSYQLRRPIGVVAGIVGWNFPLVLAAGKIGPVLATGNSLVLKPSELTSLSASRVAEFAVEAGIPEGVLNVVHGGVDVGRALAHHDAVALVTFTGSSRTGKELLVASGQSNMKRLVLECGGKAPNIVFEDAPNLDAVASAVVEGAFWNQGEVCTASSRLLVQESIKEEFLERVIRKVKEISVGDPLDPDTKFGALVSRSHCEKVRSYVEKGRGEGARLMFEAPIRAPFKAGFYASPVVFSDVSPRHAIAQEEIFGPVLAVMTFRDEGEALSLANGTAYGLSAVLWTTDVRKAHRVTYGLNAGWIVVNATETPLGGPGEGVMTVGGHKLSGFGAEGGLEGMEAYTTQTAVQLFV